MNDNQMFASYLSFGVIFQIQIGIPEQVWQGSHFQNFKGVARIEGVGKRSGKQTL